MAHGLTDKEWSQVLWLLGPWLIGGFLDFILQGVLFCQFVNYFSWYKDDKLFLRWMVAVLVLLTTLKSAQSFLLVWQQSIVHFADVEGAVELAYTTWWQSGNGLMVATIGAYVQTYFCFRLWSISRRWWVITPVATILLFAYVASVVAVYYTSTSNTPMIGLWYAAHLSSVFAGDTLLASTTAYYLLTASRSAFKQTNDMINRLARLTFQTATPAAVCAMLNLVFSQVYSGENKLVSSAFNMALPKIYAISMMWTLNARRAIRVGGHHSTGTFTSSVEQAARSRRREDVELGRLGAIQIRTETETVQQADDMAISDPKPEKYQHSDLESQASYRSSPVYTTCVIR
ncbi:hypothetical protein DFH11DRAFT_624283 [Phellopilus nigrolimitatus]|nr:hypothetical protein DFH11DRAFT_624283 [Phellopilus nigrolimitatus]